MNTRIDYWDAPNDTLPLHQESTMTRLERNKYRPPPPIDSIYSPFLAEQEAIRKVQERKLQKRLAKLAKKWS